MMQTSISEKLKFLDRSKGFTVNYGEQESQIEGENVSAVIDSYGVTYYVSGVYNSGTDYAEIDMNELMRLKEFCELLVKGA